MHVWQRAYLLLFALGAAGAACGGGAEDDAAAGIEAPTTIPLGDGRVSSTPRAGYVYSCTSDFRSGGAVHSGEWIDEDAGTWSPEEKPTVEGQVSWPAARFSISQLSTTRIITTNGLPVDLLTGHFPIAHDDPAYAFDTNPNAVMAQSFRYELPTMPQAAATPSCLGRGPIGITLDGVALFDALDDAGLDAAAHEVQDACDGHPQSMGIYHYHSVSSCILDKSEEPSTLIGYAFDGYGLYVERDPEGQLLTNADLDACHGRTSRVIWDGQSVEIYHYVVTREYPYTLGCFHGAPKVARPNPR